MNKKILTLFFIFLTGIHLAAAEQPGVGFHPAAGGGGSSLPVTDSTAIAKGSVDDTKLVRLEVDGLTTGTTRVITPPDADTKLPVMNYNHVFSGATAARTITIPDANFSVARIDASQLFVGQQKFGASPTTADSLAEVIVTPSATTQRGIVVQALASQTADPVQVQDSTKTAMFQIGKTGNIQVTCTLNAGNDSDHQISFKTKYGREIYISGTGTLNCDQTINVDRAAQFCTNSTTGAGIGFTNGFTAGATFTSPDVGLNRQAAGVWKVTDASSGIKALLGGGAAVASATAMPLPTGRVFHVTGTTNITSITSTNFQNGAVITLIFDGILTFTDGNNLKLAGNFTTAADSTITLVYDGTNWFETSRSTN